MYERASNDQHWKNTQASSSVCAGGGGLICNPLDSVSQG